MTDIIVAIPNPISIEVVQQDAALSALIAEHESKVNPHAQYATDAEITAINTNLSNKADTNHTHSGYAATDHTHSGYSPTSHTHSEYSPTSHTHSEYSPTSHSHSGYQIQSATLDAISAVSPVASQFLRRNSSNTAFEYATPAGGYNFPGTVTELAYSASQSSVYNTLAATYANMTDGSLTTGFGTNSELAWIRADLGSDHYIEEFRVAGGNIGSFGATASYIAQTIVQVSLDNSSWMWLHTLTSDPPSDSATKRYFAGRVRTRYLRLIRPTVGYLGGGELRLFGFPV